MIVVGGEALVDLVPAESVMDPAAPSIVEQPDSPFYPRWGGGPYNVALTCGRLGAPTAFLSRLSQDHFGQKLRTRLQASQVDISLIQKNNQMNVY